MTDLDVCSIVADGADDSAGLVVYVLPVCKVETNIFSIGIGIFTLLTDKDHEVMEMYGAFGKKMMYGKETTGVIRTTYIIDETGKILKIFKKVNTATHGEDIKAFLEEA